MKIIVTHTSPDWDAITSVWLIKKFLPGWEDASLQFVPAGERWRGSGGRGAEVGTQNGFGSQLESVAKNSGASANAKHFGASPRQRSSAFSSFASLRLRGSDSRSGQPSIPHAVIENINGNEVIHVDTGLGPLDHHQTPDESESAASRTWEFVKAGIEGGERWEEKKAAIERIVRVVVDTDHFKEVFWENPTADYHEFSLLGFLEGLKLQKPNEDLYYIDVGIGCLDAMLHNFENRIWAEQEIKEKKIEFNTKWGRGIGFETINDSVLKLAQKMGYAVVIRKDPRKGYVRVKARPSEKQKATLRLRSGQASKKQKEEIDLTLAYEKLKKMDPEATWYLHVSKKMLLNGTPKNPKMIPTKLSLRDIIEVLKSI